MFNATDYTYRVWYSPEDEGYIATILEYPSLSNFGETATEAMDGAVDLLADVLQDLSPEEVKVPFGRKQYSGKILLRMTPQQHRSLSMEAAEQHVSLNNLLVARVTTPQGVS